MSSHHILLEVFALKQSSFSSYHHRLHHHRVHHGEHSYLDGPLLTRRQTSEKRVVFIINIPSRTTILPERTWLFKFTQIIIQIFAVFLHRTLCNGKDLISLRLAHRYKRRVFPRVQLVGLARIIQQHLLNTTTFLELSSYSINYYSFVYKI